MKRERAMFPWELYWENKKYKLKRSILLFSVSRKRPPGMVTYDSGEMASRSLANDNNMAHSVTTSKICQLRIK